MGLVERRERLSKRARTWRRLALAVCAGSSLLILAQPAVAISPRQTLEEFFTRTNTVLQSADLTQGIEKPRNAIRNLVDETFDFRAAAAAALGSKARVAGGVSIQYVSESIDGESANVATTLLTRAGQELPVDYRMVRQGARWKVQDVVVDGVSLVMNYRSQFARVLAAQPYAELVRRMQAETGPEAPLAIGPPVRPAPSLAPPAEPIQPPRAIIPDVLADRAVKPMAVAKSASPEQPIQKSSGGGAKRPSSARAEAVRPAPPATLVGADGQKPGDVVGSLLVKSRSDAERDIDSLLVRVGGAALSRQRGAKTTVVSGVVPLATYSSFAAGLRRIGSWRLETEPWPRPTLLHVAVRLVE